MEKNFSEFKSNLSGAKVHPNAYVDPSAVLHDDVIISQGAIVGPDVTIGKGTEIGPNAVITGRTQIGINNKIFPNVFIGLEPQDLKYKGASTEVIIGDNNTFRECVTINKATDEGEKTIIGNNNLLMAYTHIGHNCELGNRIVISNSVQVAGHVRIEDKAIIGGCLGIHQFVHIGYLAMIGGMTGVLKDVIPFGLSFGNRNYLKGINLIGLRRKKYDNKKIIELDQAYKKIFSSNNLHENLSKINGEYKANELVQEVTKFIEKDKKRPICSPLSD